MYKHLFVVKDDRKLSYILHVRQDTTGQTVWYRKKTSLVQEDNRSDTRGQVWYRKTGVVQEDSCVVLEDMCGT